MYLKNGTVDSFDKNPYKEHYVAHNMDLQPKKSDVGEEKNLNGE